MPTISACIIVKNEEKNIKAFLDDVVSFADEVIIVDTGSSDDSIKLIKKYVTSSQIPIHFYEYNYDGTFHFGKARNYSIEKAKMDYIVIIDADNRTSDEFRGGIRNFLKKEKPIIALVKRVDNILVHLVEYQQMIVKNHTGIKYDTSELGCLHERFIYNYPISSTYNKIIWHCQGDNHWLIRPQRVLQQMEIEINRTPKTKSFFGHLLRGIWVFQFKFKKVYFKQGLYKDKWLGLNYAFRRSLYVFLVQIFVGMKSVTKK